MKVDITKGNGNIGGIAPSTDGISGYITNGVATANLTLGEVYKIGNVKDAEALGIDAAYDSTNGVLVYYAITEYFRFSGSLLYIMIVAQTVTMTEMCDKTNTQYAKKLLKHAGGAIKQFCVERQYPAGATPTTTGGLDNDVLIVNAGPPITRTGAIINAQALCDEEESEGRPVFCVMQGRNFNGTTTAAHDIRACNSRNVHLTIATDLSVNALGALHVGHACAASLLGFFSYAKVHESIGWPEKFNLLNEAAAKFLTPGLSSNLSINDYTAADFEALETKGYSFPVIYTDYAGVFINADPTAVDLTDDYAWARYIRTINKAIRLVRKEFTPKLNSPVLVDKATGQIAVDVAQYFEKLALSAMKPMETDGEISGRDAKVDPSQNILSTGNLAVEIEVTPYGAAQAFKIGINFKNPFNTQ